MTNCETPAGFVIEQVALTVRSLPAGRPPLRLAHLSDLHLRGLTGRHDRLAAVLAERNPDLVLLTGDVIGPGRKAPRLAAKLLPRLRGRWGTFACPGNGEVRRRMRPSALKAMMADWGVELLVNESRTLQTGSGALSVGGVDDLSLGWPDLAAALERKGPVDCAILLSHAPLAVRMLPEGAEPDLVLSGHTHGGQIRLPLVWRAVLPSCRGGFSGGLYPMPWGHLYVSRGFGTAPLVPLRWRCPAEVALIELRGPVSPCGQ